MLVSENELQEVIWRAFRGFGWPRAISKDIADAIVWLEMHDLDGLHCLAHCIRHPAHYQDGAVAPIEETNETVTFDTSNNLQTLAGDLTLNMALGKSIETGQPATVHQHNAPLPRLSLASLMSSYIPVEAIVSDHEAQFLVTRDKKIVKTKTAAEESQISVFYGYSDHQLSGPQDATVLDQATLAKTYQKNLARGLSIPDALWQQLDALAIESMVEATDASRARGAGENATIG